MQADSPQTITNAGSPPADDIQIDLTGFLSSHFVFVIVMTATAGLLRYLVSFRRHQAFHEATIEQIFVDLKTHCGCRRLVVGGYFLRRGGIDINPYRSDKDPEPPRGRLARQ